VIASLSGVDVAVAVTEPTVSGLHDLRRVLEVAGHFKVKSGVVINKYDLNAEYTRAIEAFCAGAGIPVLGKIPFSKDVSRSIVNGVPAVNYCEGAVAGAITDVWRSVQ